MQSGSQPPSLERGRDRFGTTADVKLLRENCSNVSVNLTESFHNHKQHNRLQVREINY